MRICIDANIHATELAGTTTIMFFAHELLAGYGNNPKISTLLDTCTFYLIPRVNPDGAALAKSSNPRFIRSWVRPYPCNEHDDGLLAEDIDHDGRLLQMRIVDPNGDWKISSLDSRLMEKRGIAENGGIYFRIFPEGMIKDYDGGLGTQITGYRAASTYHDFRFTPKELTTGAFDDWLYDHSSEFVFTVELWDLPSEKVIKDRKWMEWFRLHQLEDDLRIIQCIDHNGGTQAYIPCYKIDHPQLGEVDLGGWNTLFTRHNPLESLILTEASRHIPFILMMTEVLPVLVVEKNDVTPLGNHYYRIHLVIENTGFLPTYTSKQANNAGL